MRDLPGMVQKFTRKHIKGVRKEIEHLQHDLEHQLTGALLLLWPRSALAAHRSLWLARQRWTTTRRRR